MYKKISKLLHDNLAKKKILRGLVVLFLAIGWVFSGWPQILNFPPKAETVQAAGSYRASGTFTAGSGAITVPYPASMVANDVCLLVVTSENQTISLTTANGFVQVPTWSPQSAGTAAVNPGSRLAVFWKRTVGGDASPVVADSGDNTEGRIHCFSGIITTGNPWDVGAGGNDSGANDTTGVIPGATTTVDDTLVVMIISSSYNGTSTAQFSAWTNASLTGITERGDNTNTIGLGGGHGIATGVKATAGTYNSTTVTLAATSYKGAISLALKPQPGITGSVGKASDGWAGAVPVYGTLSGGLTQSSYPYARAKVDTPGGQTFYTSMTWSSANSRFEGVIYPGSNYCIGCADPTTGTFAVTVQLDNNSDFGSIDYTGATSFSTFSTRRWNATCSNVMGCSTEFNPTWNTDHWDYQVHDLSIGGTAGAQTNVAFAIPFHPITSSVSNIAVTIGGVSVSEGTAASTSNAWWWDSSSHTLYVQKASVAAATYYTLNFSFQTDTDLLAIRFDRLQTYNIGERLFYNGILFGNRYINTPMFGGGHEGSGEQVEMSARNSIDDEVNLDCMERVAVHVDNTIRADASAYYSADIKWKQDEWANYIVSEDNNSIVTRYNSDNTASTGWAQQLNNGINAYRLQTFYAGKRYLKNYYQFTNNDTASHSYSLAWGREQWLGTDRDANDQGRFQGDTSDRTPESTVAISTLTNPWFTSYDTAVFAGMGVIFEKDDPARYGYFLTSAAITNATPWAEWVNQGTEYRYDDNDTGTLSTNTFFDKVWPSVSPSSSVDFTFYQWGYSTSSWTNIESAISSDEAEINPAPVVSVSVSDGVISYGTMAAGSSKTTIDLTDTQILTNDGNGLETFNIKGQDTGCPWVLGSTPGDNQYVYQFCKKTDVSCSSPPTNYTALTASYQTLYTGVPISGTRQLDLRITVPSSSSCYDSQAISVTIQAIAD